MAWLFTEYDVARNSGIPMFYIKISVFPVLRYIQ